MKQEQDSPRKDKMAAESLVASNKIEAWSLDGCATKYWVETTIVLCNIGEKSLLSSQSYNKITTLTSNKSH